jgi:replicative DNA helicase
MKRVPVAMSQIAPEFVELQRERHEHPELYRGYPTGFPDLDLKIGGWQRDDYVSYGLARQGVRWLWAGLEEREMETVGRLFSLEGNVPRKMFRDIGLTQDEWPKVYKASDELSKFECWFYYGASDINELAEVVISLDINCVILDYVQLMKGARLGRNGSTRTQEVSEISGGLQRLAKGADRNLLMLAAAQLNKDDGWLWSEDLLRDSDVAIKIKDSLDDYGKAQENKRKVEIAKCRHGSEGAFEATFNGEIGRFETMNVRNVNITEEVKRLNEQPFIRPANGVSLWGQK